MSTKHPDDGLTDAELAEFENSTMGKMNTAVDEGRFAGLDFLEDYTRYEEQQGRKPRIPIDLGDWGGLTKPLYNRVSGEITVKATDVHDSPNLLTKRFAFQGNYGTMLRGRDLIIPDKYQDILKFGGVIAPGIDSHLMVFAGLHWERMLRVLGQQVGLDPYKNELVRHVLGRHMEFSKPNVDGTITLTKELMDYAGLKENGETFWVGMIYHAEVHDGNKDRFEDENYLTSDDVKRIFNLAKA